MGRPYEQLVHFIRRDPLAVMAWGIVAILLTVSGCVSTTPRATVAHREPAVRVHAARAEQLRVEGAGTVRVRLDGARTAVRPLPLDFARDGAFLTMTDGRGQRSTAERVELDSPRHPLRVLGRSWGSALTVLPAPDSGVDAVAPVPLERYVAGVVSGELFGSWGAECFRAQAIAARSYVVQQLSRSQHRAFDVEPDDRDQVLMAGEPLEKAIAAAASTRGLVLTSTGEVVRAYFSSTCGGRAASAQQIWPARGSLSFNASAALEGATRGSACQGSPLYRWTRSRPLDDVSKRIADWGEQAGHAARRLGSLVSVEAVEFAESGRPGWYELTDAEGNRARLRADDLRVAMNFNNGQPVRSGDVVPSNDFVVTIGGGRMNIEGRGFGHGVGLCQYCAAEWARQGYSGEQMLAAFYPGARLEKLYD